VDDVRSRLVGAWRLQSYQDRASVEDDWEDTYGPGVEGLLVYDESGWLAVQVAGRGGQYDAYFGRFAVAEAAWYGRDIRGVVTQEIVATSLPQLRDAEEERPFRLSGESLILGDEITWRRVCERAR
jgi:hypothetical protein